ncbi:MAG TPA: DUF3185 family protein [Verrucomicrobiae bacterium]|jgi:TRAP-type C4-dicarboxylate transport system permease small subunit
MQKISGLVCLVVGGLLIYWGYNMSQSLGGQADSLINGSPGNKTMLCYIGGAILLISGLGSLFWKGKA